MSTMAGTAAIPSSQTSKPTIIFCHGSGDTGPGVQAWIESLVPNSVMRQYNWIFPSAEPIPYTINGGRVSSIWYDRVGGFDPSFPEQTDTVEKSTERLIALIDEQIQKHGSGEYSKQIVIGGFSMGGAIAYQTAARWHSRSSTTPLGAVFGMSCYLNHDSKVWSMLKSNSNTKWPPTFVAHGAIDDFILPQWGQETHARLQKMGVPVSPFRLIPDTHHEMVASETTELFEF